MEPSLAHSDVLLRQKGIKASYQRVAIFDYLRHSKDHPSVSKIYGDLHCQFSRLSRATVYNTINLFVEKQLVVSVGTEGGEFRYDISLSQHGHFHCVRCQTIYDFPVKALPFDKAPAGFVVQNVQVHFRGLCPQCR